MLNECVCVYLFCRAVSVRVRTLLSTPVLTCATLVRAVISISMDLTTIEWKGLLSPAA